ncbi:MAG: nuclear transport factor 2 family protein [Proteobacteria bacterium]|nr:nuclear transport factor 2 family protein [Pseudomonadota bacterium]
MSEHSNIEIVRKGFEAFANGDMATLTDLFAEDAVWHFPGNNRISGEHRGRDMVLTFLVQTGELTGGTFRAELQNVLANDELVVVIHRQTASREGKELDMLEVNTFQFSNGKITEVRSFLEDQQAHDEFFS